MLIMSIKNMNPALCFQATTNVSFEGKYNLGQNIVEKSAKLSKIGFSIECFTDAFLSFSCTFVKFCLLGDQPATCHKFQVFQ